jgi:acetylornithine/N-succinyldiaminopimelate aminotransferase
MNMRQLFLQHNAQTSDAPLCLEIERAEGSYLYGPMGKTYIDLIGGISVCNVGHGNRKVIDAIKTQSEKYLHVMVYGEVIQSPQVEFASKLAEYLPPSLSSIYFTNSGSEATEGAMKLAKRVTGRGNIISFKNSYHGSTQGALSVMGSEYWQQAYRPLLPGIEQYEYGSYEAIHAIDTDTAAIILELVQSEAGVIVPDTAWLQAIKSKCVETGCLFIADEIQNWIWPHWINIFRFEQCGLIPDILLLGQQP